MRITKFEHSGFLIQNGVFGLLIDPVEYERALPNFENIEAVVLTHKHSDHFQPKVLEKILAQNPSAKVFTTNDTAPEIAGSIAVKADDSIRTEHFGLEFFGQSHAEIVPGVIPCENIGVVVDGIFAHPGDSFDLPKHEVAVIAVASDGPWLKTYEAMEYISKAKAKCFVPCHDAFSSELGRGVNNNWLGRACAEAGVELKVLTPEESLEI